MTSQSEPGNSETAETPVSDGQGPEHEAPSENATEDDTEGHSSRWHVFEEPTEDDTAGHSARWPVTEEPSSGDDPAGR